MNEITKTEAVLVNTESATLMQIIERASVNPQVDVEKMERLFLMHEGIVKKQAEMAFNTSMSEAQSKSRRVEADATNPQTRSKYASYAALDRSLRPIYTGTGFSLSFDTGDGAPQDWVRVVCYVAHSGGHSRKYHIDMPADGKGAKGGDVMTKTHATGSAMSYGMRYLLKMIFNVAVGEDDDDGNGANITLVTENQAADMQCLAEEVGANVPAFLQFLSKKGKVSITSYSEIPANMHADAIELLERKRKK